MKNVFIAILLFTSLFTACKKSDSKDPDKKEESDPNKQPYPGRLSSFWGYPVYYNSQGLLTEYSWDEFQNANQKSTATLIWESDKMTHERTGGAFGLNHAVYNRNASGNCLPSQQDPATSWTWDSLNRLQTVEGINYYWTGENVDSIQYLGYTEIYQYSTALETRNFGMKFIPRLDRLIPYFTKNLRIKSTRLSSNRDTVDVHYYGHEFNAAGQVIKETDTTKVHGTAQNITVGHFTYYE
jgi:hypothetical protein